MCSLSIASRPRTWDGIVGQDRAVRVLKDILSTGKFSPRGFTLEGPHGVGKTTTGYVLSRALLCTGGDPLGCGTCPSCQIFKEHPDSHPDFREVDGASVSGVAQARQIVDEALELPGVGRVRVLLIDEAHRLSREAWDVYLKPLEQPDSKCVFIFATTDARKIPETIRSRCCPIKFNRVATDVLTGFLVSQASKNSIDYELDGIRCIARASKGHVRDALVLLDKVSSMGKATRDLTESVVDTRYSDLALNMLVHLAAGSLPDAIVTLDEMARAQPVPRAVSEVFSAYGRAVFGDPDASPDEAKRFAAVKMCFPLYASVTSVLLKWSSTERIPADALPLFAYELFSMRTSSGESAPATPQREEPRAKVSSQDPPQPTGSSSRNSLVRNLNIVKATGR